MRIVVKPAPTKGDWLQFLNGHFHEGSWIVSADKLEALLAVLADRGFEPRDLLSAAWKRYEW